MRLWVDSEYAGELAVVSAWVVAVLPWNVTLATLPDLGSLLFVRFPLGQVRYAFGVPVGEAVAVQTAYGAWRFQAGQSIADAYAAWLVGAALVAVAVALSGLIYARMERLPVPPVRTMGGLLLAAGAAFAAATVLLWTRGFPGVPIPVGVVFAVLLGVVLVRVEQT